MAQLSPQEQFAALAVVDGQMARAAQLTGALEGAYEAVGYRIEDADRLFLERYMKRGSSIGESAFARATREGRAMSLTHAVALAIETTRPT